MPQIEANQLSLEYDTFGDKNQPPLLLVMGLGAQMTLWREEFCQQLADSGFWVIRFDNRDIGLSDKMTRAGDVNIPELMMKQAMGQPVSVPYTLDDMAADALALLAALNISQAHICGASMGGMIVQQMAIKAPERILSLTSIMSTTGEPDLPQATDEAIGALLAPPGNNRQESIDRVYNSMQIICSKVYQEDEATARARIAQAYDRSYYPEGMARQTAAIITQSGRRSALEQLNLPALVIHGADDPLVPPACGEATHRALAGSDYLVVKGMAHDIPEPVWPEVIGAISAKAQAKQVSAG